MTAAFSIFSLRLGYPRVMVFDEHHYVPASKELIQIQPNRNYEHPPLGKFMMGIAIATLGDHPVGWRAASCLAGTLAIGAVFWLALGLYGDLALAALAGWFALTSGLLLTMSRLAMLDVFAAAFSLLALAALISRRTLLSALSIGVAISCKWSAIPVWGMMLLVYPICRRRIAPRKPFNLGWWLTIALLPVLVYALSYAPLALVEAPGHSPMDLVQMQTAMWQAQVQLVKLHQAHVPWWDWPLKFEPWWLFGGATGESGELRLMMLANPVVILGGALAIFALIKRAILGRDVRDAYLVANFAAVYLIWALSLRSNQFYYYFLPGSLILSIALARTVMLLAKSLVNPHYKYLLVALITCVSGAWLFANISALTAGPWH